MVVRWKNSGLRKEREICPKIMIMSVFLQRPINYARPYLGTCLPGRYYISSAFIKPSGKFGLRKLIGNIYAIVILFIFFFWTVTVSGVSCNSRSLTFQENAKSSILLPKSFTSLGVNGWVAALVCFLYLQTWMCFESRMSCASWTRRRSRR